MLKKDPASSLIYQDIALLSDESKYLPAPVAGFCTESPWYYLLLTNKERLRVGHCATNGEKLSIWSADGND